MALAGLSRDCFHNSPWHTSPSTIPRHFPSYRKGRVYLETSRPQHECWNWNYHHTRRMCQVPIPCRFPPIVPCRLHSLRRIPTPPLWEGGNSCLLPYSTFL